MSSGTGTYCFVQRRGIVDRVFPCLSEDLVKVTLKAGQACSPMFPCLKTAVLRHGRIGNLAHLQGAAAALPKSLMEQTSLAASKSFSLLDMAVKF